MDAGKRMVNVDHHIAEWCFWFKDLENSWEYFDGEPEEVGDFEFGLVFMKNSFEQDMEFIKDFGEKKYSKFQGYMDNGHIEEP